MKVGVYVDPEFMSGTSAQHFSVRRVLRYETNGQGGAMYNLVRVSVLAVSLLLVAGTIGAGPKPPDHPLKLVLARQSTIPIVDVMKNLTERCPNVTITTDPHRSDFMLYAGGWSGEYRFMIIAKGGDTVFATKTVLLSNAVKDVCRFLNSKT
jgi:hypothetical protein